MNWDGRIINEQELAPYLKSRDGGLASRVAALVEHQKNSWPLMREGYAAFAEIETRRVEAAGSRAIIQHNPRRIASTAARVDKASVEARRCFLCAANLPPEEKGLAYDDELVILCNPFPILDKHLSIVHREHIPQKIEGNVEALLALARDLESDFFVLYNGPECGASAPDHLHFQAASRNLPIEDELRRMDSESSIATVNEVESFAFSGFNRSAIILRGADSERLVRSIYRAVSELSLIAGKAEPMINIICVYAKGEWTVYLFPRARHRPACYFAEGEGRIAVSPGAIDMAGLVVVPHRDDFAKVDAEQVRQIFSEVSMDYETVRKLVEKLGPRAGQEDIGGGHRMIDREPSIRVGLVTGASHARVTLSGGFSDASGHSVPEGDYSASVENGAIRLHGEKQIQAPSLILSPNDFDACRFTVHDVTIGIDFHWQRKESQSFQGALSLLPGDDGLTVINELPLESYLVSVISSEMSASCPAELLRAHAIVSRGWLLAQLERAENQSAEIASHVSSDSSSREIIRWYSRENHVEFDVCADDHCQRYQGISKAYSQAAFDAVRDTRGRALVSGGEICDARYSKSCGGITEEYRAAWEDRDVPYLSTVYDGEGSPDGYAMPLTVESNAEAWITSSPVAYCNTSSPELLSRILPGFDQETRDFYRWEVSYSADELSEIIGARMGVDVGRILAIEAMERGLSGRIIKLKIEGEKESIVIGKELEIRRALSRSHLYSSAFVVKAEKNSQTGDAERFRLIGAGWGHGVGLCQIGAAVMADRRYRHEEILAHYFRYSTLKAFY